jgi:hypothetical protein
MHCWWIFDFETDYTYKFFVLVILLILAHHSFLRFIYYLKKTNLLGIRRFKIKEIPFQENFPCYSTWKRCKHSGHFSDFTLFSEIFVGIVKKNVMYLSCFIICHFVLHIKKLLICINTFIYLKKVDVK